MPFKGYGVDYTAYVNQAGQFISGQTNYLRITSVQGPCFYPAGHLWHYVPIYYLHISTEHAEDIVKVLHLLLLVVQHHFISKIAYSYFAQHQQKAQILSIILTTNMSVKLLNAEMFNDSILSIYIILCIYFVQ